MQALRRKAEERRKKAMHAEKAGNESVEQEPQQEVQDAEVQETEETVNGVPLVSAQEDRMIESMLLCICHDDLTSSSFFAAERGS